MYRQLTKTPPPANPTMPVNDDTIMVPMLDGYRHGNVWRTKAESPEERVTVQSAMSSMAFDYVLAKMIEPSPEFGHPFAYIFVGSKRLE